METDRKPKQVIVMRADLKMQRGKEIAQGAHASMSFIAKRLGKPDPDFDKFDIILTQVEQQWLFDGKFTKIAVKVDSEQELDDIYAKAVMAGLETHVITDSGLTVFHGVPTKTCLAIGPDWPEKIDPITKGLGLR
jgi:PTH2 family peptidyl-tRNA hydrolase